jgi:hypothetical protein
MIAHKDDLPRTEESRRPPRMATYRWGVPPSWQERVARERRERLMTSLDEERRMLADRRLTAAGEGPDARRAME